MTDCEACGHERRTVRIRSDCFLRCATCEKERINAGWFGGCMFNVGGADGAGVNWWRGLTPLVRVTSRGVEFAIAHRTERR